MAGIHFPMPEKKKDTRKRDRLLLEMPEGGREVWRKVRSVSYERGVSMGTLIIEVLRKEFGVPPDKPKKK